MLPDAVMWDIVVVSPTDIEPIWFIDPDTFKLPDNVKLPELLSFVKIANESIKSV